MKKETIEVLKEKIETCYRQGNQGDLAQYKDTVFKVIEYLTTGELRVATPPAENLGEWTIHPWLKQAILLYFRVMPMKNHEYGEELSYFDRIPLQTQLEQKRIRLVPPAILRYGAHVERGVIMMPSFVNIGAYVGENTMIDTWATVGSCAQIGKNVHLSGGVGIGGVIEPIQALPVLIEDHVFVGSRVVVVEGVRVEQGAVLGAGVNLTASTPIIDVSGKEERQYRRKIPAYSIVIPGNRIKQFPAGNYSTPAALIIGKRNEKTDKKTSLEKSLRDFSVGV